MATAAPTATAARTAIAGRTPTAADAGNRCCRVWSLLREGSRP
jgi:hypothetical protein